MLLFCLKHLAVIRTSWKAKFFFSALKKIPFLKLNNDSIKLLEQVLDTTYPNRVSKNLRRIVFAYLETCHTNLPTDFDEMLFDLDQLFNILDIIKDCKSNQ
jgi:hypothetical protein